MKLNDPACSSDVAASRAEGCVEAIDRDDSHQARMEQLVEAQAWATLSVAAAIRERG